MKNTSGILSDIAAFILSGGKRTKADNTRTILNEIAVSYPNFLDGGLNFESAVGYKDDFRPIAPNAFATVDMVPTVSGGSKVTNSTTISLLTNDSNWTDNEYTGTAISGQHASDWYRAGGIWYFFDTSTFVIRIPYKYL
jgi:hypothetical protein